MRASVTGRRRTRTSDPAAQPSTVTADASVDAERSHERLDRVGSPTLVTMRVVTTGTDRATTGHTVTGDQVARAVVQLRERPGRPAAEQIRAVLRALDLTVATPTVPAQRR